VKQNETGSADGAAETGRVLCIDDDVNGASITSPTEFAQPIFAPDAAFLSKISCRRAAPATVQSLAVPQACGMNGTCNGCGEPSWLIPLHGDKGGPLRCFMCAGAWNAKYTRRRKWGRHHQGDEDVSEGGRQMG
jgi:hypothetical protein